MDKQPLRGVAVYLVSRGNSSVSNLMQGYSKVYALLDP